MMFTRHPDTDEKKGLRVAITNAISDYYESNPDTTVEDTVASAIQVAGVGVANMPGCLSENLSWGLKNFIETVKAHTDVEVTVEMVDSHEKDETVN